MNVVGKAGGAKVSKCVEGVGVMNCKRLFEPRFEPRDGHDVTKLSLASL